MNRIAWRLLRIIPIAMLAGAGLMAGDAVAATPGASSPLTSAVSASAPADSPQSILCILPGNPVWDLFCRP